MIFLSSDFKQSTHHVVLGDFWINFFIQTIGDICLKIYLSVVWIYVYNRAEGLPCRINSFGIICVEIYKKQQWS